MSKNADRTNEWIKEDDPRRSKDKRNRSENPGKKGQGYYHDPKKGKTKPDWYVASDTQDPEWYMRNDRLVQDNAKIPWEQIAGTSIKLRGKGNSTEDVMNYTVPGIMALQYMTGPGIANSANDGVNIAASILFQNIRKELSTYASYSQADVICYVMAYDDLVSQYCNLVRLFGLVNAYSAYNLYTPKALVCAGYNWDDVSWGQFINNLNNWRAEFNTLIYKAATIYCPVDFPIMKRHAWLFTNAFYDVDNNYRGQFYIPAKYNYYMLDETSSDQGTKCTSILGLGADIETLLDNFNNCIEAFRNSDSMMKIASDMRRAYSDKVGAVKFSYVPENYINIPLRPKYYLEQLHNADIACPFIGFMSNGMTGEIINADITQDVNKNIVLWQPKVEWTVNTTVHSSFREFREADLGLYTGDKLANVYGMNPDDAMICEITRNKIMGDNIEISTTTEEGISKITWDIISCGVDFIVGAAIYSKYTNNGVISDSAPHIFATILSDSFIGREYDKNIFDPNLGILSDAMNFDYHPMIYTASKGIVNGTPTTDVKYRPIAELDHWATISRNNVINLDRAILTSCWSIPTFGL